MGALSGYRVIELAGIGPAPMTGMMMADMGAEVIRVEKSLQADPFQKKDASFRGKKSIVIDLKHPDGVASLLALIETADVLIDPYRPGVCEKLGFGPNQCLARNPKLIFGRITGWGQDGPLAQAAGHDINYISLTGALNATGERDGKPLPALNLVGDMGGGAMLLMNGVLAALLEVKASGKGQVVDAAMVDGAAQMMWMFHGFEAAGLWDASSRKSNILDGGAPFYDTYECSDGKFVAIGAIEPQFFSRLLEKTGLEAGYAARQFDKSFWPVLATELAAVFKTKTQSEWSALMEGTDVCFAPVLSFKEAPDHPANKAREVYMSIDGFHQPAPAPRFSRTPSRVRHGAPLKGADTDDVLRAAGLSAEAIASLRKSGAVS